MLAKEGRRIRSSIPMEAMIPFIMPSRSGASNSFYATADITKCEQFIRQKRQEGMTGLGMMHVIIAAYARTISQYPGINRYIRGQRIYARLKIVNHIEFVPPKPYEEIEVLDTNITIRPVTTEEDALEAIRCIYSEYGYTYGYEKMYYVESLLEMNRKREVLNFLAVNDHGQIAGHFALTFSDIFENLAEYATVVVRKEFRSLGLFSKYLEYADEVIKREGIRGIFAQPVGYHPFSQKGCLSSGMIATSFLLSYISTESKNQYETVKRRSDLMSCVRIADPQATSRIYPPKPLEGFIQKVYNNLGWTYEFLTGPSIADATVYSVEDNSYLKNRRIVVRQSADDLRNVLSSLTKEAFKRKIEMIELLISMRDSSCEYAYEVAKERHFFFSGILPGGENDDYLVMQMIVGEDPDYDALIVVDGFKDLLQDVIEINNNKGDDPNEL